MHKSIDLRQDCLGVIDMQPDFMPGGKLAVPGGDAILAPVNQLLNRFTLAFATQDWHPPCHVSFASSHPGRAPYEQIQLAYGAQTLWPEHCVRGTPGASLHRDLALDHAALILRKGMDRAIDSYSAFFENDRQTATGLNGWLRERGVRRLFLCGLATDFCVAWTAEDAATLGYAVLVVEDACRGIGIALPEGGTTIDAAKRRLAALGVEFSTTAEVLA
jgi:nicotinamidase/pyrazinamidase